MCASGTVASQDREIPRRFNRPLAVKYSGRQDALRDLILQAAEIYGLSGSEVLAYWPSEDQNAYSACPPCFFGEHGLISQFLAIKIGSRKNTLFMAAAAAAAISLFYPALSRAPW